MSHLAQCHGEFFSFEAFEINPLQSSDTT